MTYPIHPVTGQPGDQWIAALSDYLPRAYMHAHASQLSELFRLGATVAEAATYARAYLRAPRVELDDLSPEESAPFQALRAETGEAQMARALETRERMERDRDL